MLLWSVLLLICSTPLPSRATCTTKSSQDHFVLRAHTYRSFTADRYPTCLAECEKDSKCMSLNFCRVHFICELNHQTSFTKPTWYGQKKYSIYAEPAATRHPVGSKKNPGKSCKRILQVLQKTTSDHYWIDPKGSGNPFKVYCDMETEGGGWTLLKRRKMKSAIVPDGSLDVTTAAYTDISDYDGTKYLDTTGMLQLKTDMGFDQFRFFCFKKSVGNVIHIMTTLNSSGLAVVDYYTQDSITVQPQACGSYTVLPRDTSVLSRDCRKWGNDLSGFEVNKWALYYSLGNTVKLYLVSMAIENLRAFRMKIKYSCDDHATSPQPVSVGDVWEIYVR